MAPVIIDLPQVVNAAGNSAAFAMLERNVNDSRATLGRDPPAPQPERQVG
jgi:RIO kinase 1